MGHVHMLGGTAAWLAACTVTAPTVGVLTAGAAVATGAALLNDIDHEHSIARSILGPITVGLSWLVRTGCGGQRRITHCLLGTFLFSAGIAGAASYWHWPSWVVVALLTGWTSHIALDMCTKQGCPLLWPLSMDRFGLPRDVAITTGGKHDDHGKRGGSKALTAEHLLVVPALLTVAVIAVYMLASGIRP